MPDPKAEAERLWLGVFGEPPSISAHPNLLLQVLVSALPAAPPYRPEAARATATPDLPAAPPRLERRE